VHRLGIDAGGTFTDFVVHDETTGALAFHKRLTTPADILDGLVEGIDACRAASGVRLTDLHEVRHGTTLGSNVIIERKGPKTALLTTRGVRDVLHIQRGLRYTCSTSTSGSPLRWSPATWPTR
jgi:N-methylhydantoinase A